MSDPMKVSVEIEVQEIADAIIRKLTEDETLVEVVRCKGCKYYQRVYGGVPLGEVGHCICHSFETVPDWFCADGERRENETLKR